MEDHQAKSMCSTSPCLSKGVKYKTGRISLWNLGGQNIDTLNVVLQDSDFIAVQEVARDEPGWKEYNDDQFCWLLHRHEHQYRGVGLGVAQDLFDCIVDKTATERGIWALVRVKGIGRVVLGSLHCHTGATQKTYASAVHTFFKAFKRKWRGYPIMLGVDANEQPTWNKENENEDDFNITNTSVNLEALLEEVYNLGLKAVTPIDSQLSTPTHYPRDPMRTGRQIDMLFTKSLMVSRSRIRPDMRHCIGTDHAEINCDIFSSGSRFQPWGSDTRPRKLSALLPHQHTIVDGDDLCHLAQTCTRPKCSPSYHDSDEIKQMIAKAKATNDPTLWKKVHKTRRRARNEWIKSRSSAVLQGDWGAFRSYQKDKRRRKGWWGRMLTDKSAAELTQEVQSHLEEKMTDPANSNWDEVVSGFIERLVLPEHWQPFTKEEIFETLSHMKPHAAVGEDIICVDLLKAIVLHDNLGEQFVALLNHIVHHNQQPESWGVSILALLAKCADPAAPGDLRPICVGSNFAKLTNRLVMARVFPVLRRGSRCSTCGKNRQVADLVGVMTRMRDMLHEWREPLLIAKLDVAGAFDRLSRPKVAELIIERTQHTNLGREVRYMLQQLGVNQLKGTVPGGHSINIKANVGIRQGAPESAELFGLVMGLMLDTMLDTKDWMAIGAPVQDLDIELLFFQDDIFVFETSTARLARKINLVGDVLHGGGLCLAMKKTKIVATADYKGKMVVEIAGQEVKIQKNESIKVLGVNFNFSAPAAQQAEELLGRARGAFEEHRHLLMAKGSWKSKAFTMAMLITSTWRWVAGAVHWSRESLCKANSLQAQILRTSFKMSRTSDENWVDWNKRTLRTVRCFLHKHQIPRWSTTALTMQHQLLGHWARTVETLEDGTCMPGITMRSLRWRCMQWWEQQQALPHTGRRHPRAFYPSNMERQISSAVGSNWFSKASDRIKWRESLALYLDKFDVKWTSGRQCAIAM